MDVFDDDDRTLRCGCLQQTAQRTQHARAYFERAEALQRTVRGTLDAQQFRHQAQVFGHERPGTLQQR